MKIAIDYRLAASSNRGMARYCREMVNQLFILDSTNTYYLMVYSIPKDLRMPDNFHFINLKCSNYIISEQLLIPKFLKVIKPDILWCPYNTFPIFLSKNIKLYVTIHDLIFMEKSCGKENFYKKFGRLYRKFILKYFKNRIHKYFTVSEYSKRQIENILTLDCAGYITYSCLSEDFITLSKKYTNIEKKNYYFTVSGDSPSKNLLFLIDFFNKFMKDDVLYIAGLSKSSNYRRFQNKKIVFLDENITDDEIIFLYSSCKAFIFPSLKEGFGLPLIEAACCGAKVISSNYSCLPEIVENRGMLFDPTDSQSLLHCLKTMDDFIFSYDVSKYMSWEKSARIVYNAMVDIT